MKQQQKEQTDTVCEFVMNFLQTFACIGCVVVLRC
jgi:hypothetical protein